MSDLVTILPFTLIGVSMVVFGLVLNHQSTLSARRLDEQARETSFPPLHARSGDPIATANINATTAESRRRETQASP